jgi:2-dehydropantoate 2-reductase
MSQFKVEWWTEEKPDLGPVREVSDGQPISNLIVATKAPDALPQVDRLHRYLSGLSTVAFVQNGMNRLWPPLGAQYNAARYKLHDHPNWIVCVTTHGVTGLGPFKSIHASPADVAVGSVLLNDRTAASSDCLIQQILDAPNLDARRVSSPDLWVLQLEKLVVNCIINPLTAILRCKNGKLFEKQDGPIMRVMDLLLYEASQVLQALVRDDSSRTILTEADTVGDAEEAVESRRQQLLDRFSTNSLRRMLLAVGDRVKDNRSSMLQDVTAGKKTEIGEFNGWLVDTAQYLGGLDISTHARLIRLVEGNATLDEAHLEKSLIDGS